jgi:hypothetical protein
MFSRAFSQEPRFVLGEKDLNVCWYFPAKGIPRLEINVGPAKVTASLPLLERGWRLVDTAEPERGSSHLRFTLADAAGQQMVVTSSLVAERSAARVTFQLPSHAGDASAVSLKGEASEALATVNSLPGTVVVGSHLFIAAEHPASAVTLSGKSFDFQVPLASDMPEVALAVGPLIEGARYRAFRRYVDASRSRPARPFLHYNSWYDIGYDGKSYDEAESRQVIRTIKEKLVTERQAPLDGFVLDDGWDDKTTLWRFHSGFPQGFKPLMTELPPGEVLGTWLSPWGGYNEARIARLAIARKQGFTIGENGLMLSDPRYFAFFSEAAREMALHQNVKYLKLDGIGSPAGLQGNNPGLRKEFLTFLELLRQLRKDSPDLFINATVGTFPSPFWLWYADSIWRGGGDCDQRGEGPTRERWITYRDEQVYNNVVKPAPHFPLSSLMLHGVVYAIRGQAAKLDYSPESFRHEVRSYFATGVYLQEFHITPALLSEADWAAIAEGAIWARERSALFTDSHWFGGDPGKGQVYGYASWGDGRGVLSIRNPSAQEQTFRADVADLLEIPLAQRVTIQGLQLKEPWTEHVSGQPLLTRPGEPLSLVLGPFDQRVYDVDIR